MVGSKCRDFKNCEVNNVNAPRITDLQLVIVHTRFNDYSQGCALLDPVMFTSRLCLVMLYCGLSKLEGMD